MLEKRLLCIDTLHVTGFDRYHQSPDTIFVGFRTDVNALKLSAGYDYEIFIPGTSVRKRISNIDQTEDEQQVCILTSKLGCINQINSYKDDGVLVIRGPNIILKK